MAKFQKTIINENAEGETVTQAQIDAWKKEFGDGNIFVVSTPHINVDPNLKLKAYIKKPGIVTMNKISRFGDDHIDKAIDIFFEDSYLGGDPEIKNYDEYRISIFTKVMPMFQVPDSVIAKL